MPIVERIDCDFLDMPDFENMDINQKVQECTKYIDYLKSLSQRLKGTPKQFELENRYNQIQNQVQLNLIEINKDIENN